jgi:hypothetical protein
MSGTPVTVLTLVEDLMFASRIAETAKARGGASLKVRSVEALREAAAAGTAKVVVVDLDRPPAPLADIVAAASGLPIVGFFSHVEPERGREARKLGFARVLPRSAFVKELPDLV